MIILEEPPDNKHVPSCYLYNPDVDGPLAPGYPWGREENSPQPASCRFDFDTTAMCHA